MANKDYLSYLLTLEGRNYYLSGKTGSIYANEYRKELNIDLSKFVPAGSLVLLNLPAYTIGSHISMAIKLAFLLFGFILAGCLAELLARKKRGPEFRVFHFETLFNKGEFLQLLTRNIYGKLIAGLFCGFLTLYQVMEYLDQGLYVSHLVSCMAFFITYLAFIQSHLGKQFQLLRKLKKAEAGE